MIIAPTPGPVGPVLRIDRIITVDDAGDERWWDYDDLLREHPEVFTRRAPQGGRP